MRASSTRRGCCTAIRSARSRVRPSRPCWAGSGSSRPLVVLVSATTTPGACPARSRGAEALFRTLKYSPDFPRQGFATLEAARDWVHAFADWYNTVHRHRSIQPACCRQVCHVRYRAEKWSVITGIVGVETSALISTYDFAKEVIGYDLAAFFERNRETLKNKVNTVLKNLLDPS